MARTATHKTGVSSLLTWLTAGALALDLLLIIGLLALVAMNGAGALLPRVLLPSCWARR